MRETEQRSAVLVEARNWLGTPYHHMGRVKGVGADCATFPAEVYAAVGLIAPPDIDFYPPDWHLHAALRPDQSRPKGPGQIPSHELYLARVTEYAIEVESPCPGDFALWRIGRAFAHGAIVIAWPRIIHAVVGIGVIEDDGEAPTLAFGRSRDRATTDGKRPRKFFSLWIARPEAVPSGRVSASR
jgi:cell wall-associated NlpC family hydrolase